MIMRWLKVFCWIFLFVGLAMFGMGCSGIDDTDDTDDETESIDDHGDDCSTATPVSLNSTTSGSIEAAEDEDYFRVDVTSSGTLTVYTTTTDDSTHTYGFLYNSGCIFYLESSGFGDGLDNLNISQYVTPGTYYVAVEGYSTGAVANYTLKVNFSGGDSIDDNGNHCSTATAVSLNSTRSGVINYGRDIDVFRVDVTSSGTLSVYTTGIAANTYGYLKDSDCMTLAASNYADYNFRISQYVTAGTYYLKVSRNFISTL